MYVYCVEKLHLDIEKVNVNGGSIALGHPLDESFSFFILPYHHLIPLNLRATGARQIATGLAELRRRNKKVLLLLYSPLTLIGLFPDTGNIHVHRIRHGCRRYVCRRMKPTQSSWLVEFPVISVFVINRTIFMIFAPALISALVMIYFQEYSKKSRLAS